MVIEQTLMRSMKSSGGLTGGRGVSDSVLAIWVGGSPTAVTICSSIEEFAGKVFSSGEQHIDFRVSRRKSDEQDTFKIYEWFVNHPPFPELPSLMSLSTGVIGNSKTNSYQALEIGTRMMKSFIGSNFGDIKQSKKNVVLPLVLCCHL
ncbi:hypothetical protein AVEN_34892-1 [Araneus ventricosus]|uniref:Uncharacterized protein n=1 Tax=Araneus ventricosus TaxID=182803 RepID=A0A4Y2ULN7_ARAVE|nr:hypothetical protein AVEN_34892-1 [Araneus ventricosus]